MNIKIFFCLLIFGKLSSAKLYGQIPTLKPGKKVFSGESVTQNNRKALYKVYFIIGNETIKHHGQLYNSLVISEDSTDICGYIRYDSIEKKLFFISKYIKDTDAVDECPNIKKTQTLFSFHAGVSKKLCFAGFLGHNFYIFTKDAGYGKFAMQILSEDDLGSHIEYIDELLFDNSIYPYAIRMVGTAGDRFFLE